MNQTPIDNLIELVKQIGIATGHKDMSLHTAKVFFEAARADLANDPLQSREIADRIGMSTSGVCRAVALLGEWHRNKPGLGLLLAVSDLPDRRRKPVRLTLRGRKAVEHILKTLQTPGASLPSLLA